MSQKSQFITPRRLNSRINATRQTGLSLIELMIAITLGLLIMTALITLFVDMSRTNSEMAKTNAQIENGRFAMQLMQNDIVHAGFWGGFVPEFDDLTASTSSDPAGLPTAVPAPCLAYASWNLDYRNNLIVLPVQAYDSPPAGCAASDTPAGPISNIKANTDVLVVRHVATCVSGVGSCDNTANKLYFQPSSCETELSATAQAATTTTITLASISSSTDDFYNGSSIRIKSGPGAGQSRTILDYNGSTKVATISTGATDWASPLPTSSSIYTFAYGYVLGTSGFGLSKRNCTTLADKRKFISNIYYIRDYAITAGDGIPTLMRSEFDLASGTLAHKAAEPLINGIEGFRVELGIDNISDDGTNIINDANPTNRYTAAIKWADDDNLVSPVNRGDGSPDQFVRCPVADIAADTTPPSTHPAATVCTEAQLANVVAVKLYVLARADKATAGYTDTKIYTLGTTTLGPFNDSFKRHVFSSTVRLNNVSSRRETP